MNKMKHLFATALLAGLAVSLAAEPPQDKKAAPAAPVAPVQAGPSVPTAAKDATPERPRVPASPLQVLAFTLRHQPVDGAANLVRLRLTPRGTVEEQPSANTLVVRDVATSIDQIRAVIAAYDVPSEQVRFDIRVVQAGPLRSVISPPAATATLDEDLATRLRGLLRYEDFRVLAQAGLSSRAGEQVSYSLGTDFDVSFRLVSVVEGKRVKLEGFKVVRRPPRSADKSRQLPPQQLFQATLNLWLDKPFTLVLTRDEERKEALMIAITCRLEKAP